MLCFFGQLIIGFRGQCYFKSKSLHYSRRSIKDSLSLYSIKPRLKGSSELMLISSEGQ